MGRRLSILSLAALIVLAPTLANTAFADDGPNKSDEKSAEVYNDHSDDDSNDSNDHHDGDDEGTHDNSNEQGDSHGSDDESDDHSDGDDNSSNDECDDSGYSQSSKHASSDDCDDDGDHESDNECDDSSSYGTKSDHESDDDCNDDGDHESDECSDDSNSGYGLKTSSDECPDDDSDDDECEETTAYDVMSKSYVNPCTPPPPPPVDVCPNPDGVQTELPAGYYFDKSGNCLPEVVLNPMITASSSCVDDHTVTISGTTSGFAEGELAILVRRGDTDYGSTTATANGNYSIVIDVGGHPVGGVMTFGVSASQGDLSYEVFIEASFDCTDETTTVPPTTQPPATTAPPTTVDQGGPTPTTAPAVTTTTVKQGTLPTTGGDGTPGWYKPLAALLLILGIALLIISMRRPDEATINS